MVNRTKYGIAENNIEAYNRWVGKARLAGLDMDFEVRGTHMILKKIMYSGRKDITLIIPEFVTDIERSAFEHLSYGNTHVIIESEQIKHLRGVFGRIQCDCLTVESHVSQKIDLTRAFEFCDARKIDLSKFDMGKAEIASNMFNRSRAVEIDFGEADTSNMVNMGGMFNKCGNLVSLNLSSFDTSKVKNMAMMFRECSSLRSLDISNFDTSSVGSMQYMFKGCISLHTLKFKPFNMSKVEHKDAMFKNSGLPDKIRAQAAGSI